MIADVIAAHRTPTSGARPAWCALTVAALILAATPSAYAEAPAANPLVKPSKATKTRPRPAPVHIHISADAKDVSLVRAGEWNPYESYYPPWRTHVCKAPCDQLVDPEGRFFVVNGSSWDSDPFSMSDQVGKTTLVVDAGSSAAMWTWGSLVGGGSATALTGALLTSVWDNDDPRDNLQTPGLVLMGIGISAMAASFIALPFTFTNVDVVGDGRRARTPRYWRGEF